VRVQVRIRKAPHAGRPELVGPTSLIFAYRERAAGTGVSIVARIGPQAIMVIVRSVGFGRPPFFVAAVVPALQCTP
jgi:hypothetical protein